MTNQPLLRNRKNNGRNVFRKSTKTINRNFFRQLVEGVLMLTGGIYLIKFLNSLPQSYNIGEISTIMWKDTLVSILHMFDAVMSLFKLLTIIFLVSLCFALLLGGIWRLMKVFTTKLSTSRKKSNPTFKLSKRR